MKILLVFTLCLISGPVSCFNVTGYSGGSVIIHCRDKQYGKINKSFCKETPNQTPKQCVFVRFQNKWNHKDRISLRDSSEVFTVIYRNLSLQDAGSYRCGEAGAWSHDVNLEVKTDPCCLGSNTVSGYLGETVTISCSYPEEFKTNYQYLFKQDGEGFTEVNRTSETQRGRFSFSDDRRSAVLRVRISDVREADGGVYYCGVWTGGESVSYYSLYTETQLQVTAKETPPSPKQLLPGGPSSTSTTTAAPTGTTSDKHFTPGSSVIIIPVCVCVALLLIGGSALIYYKLRCTKTQGSISSSNVAKMGSNNRIPPHSACDYEEIRDPRPNADTGATPLSVELPSDPPNAVTVTEQQPSNSPVQHIYSEVDLPTEAHTYATVCIQNEDSHTDATVAFHTGNSATMYATVKPPTAGMTINKP
uniref:Ig-like domain-containing protein n=1 Tax=Pygocentrus nattereri TaxID=42514 RepID=A0AAR2J4Q9_PYGNA